MLPGPSSVSRALGALGGLALAAAVVAPAGASFPGVNGEIVTQSFKDNRALAAVSEAGVRTELPIEGGYPGFSPDGATLVYSCGDDLCSADADGTDERLLAKAPASTRYRWPGFSKDAKTLVFVEGSGTLSVMRADGTQLREIPKSGQAWQPEFSPTSGRILFSRKAGKSRDLYSVKANGRGLKRLTNSPTGFQDINPSFSPDGKRIAFERIERSANGITRDAIWVIEADGDNAEPLVAESGDALAATPAFSPDGKKIAFSFNELGQGAHYALWTMNADGSDRALLNDQPALQPAWRPLP